MNFILPIEDMTIEEKLATMERLWDDLCRDPASVPSPAWHKDVLFAREEQVKEGKAKFSGLDVVKERIRESIK
jgi:putative addiction module component (TIGR02574 family)